MSTYAGWVSSQTNSNALAAAVAVLLTTVAGGGSSDAAGVLLGLNRLYGEPFPRARLLAMGKGRIIGRLSRAEDRYSERSLRALLGG